MADFVVSGTDLNTATALDYETKNTYTVTIQASNGVDPPIQQDFVLNVTNVIEGTLGPTTSTFVDNDPPGTVVFTVTGLDVGANEIIYSISPNDGRVAIDPTSKKIIVGTSASIAGTINLTVNTSAGRSLNNTITVTASTPVTPTIINPTVSGTGTAGNVLTVDPGQNWAGFPVHHYEYQWLRNGVAPVGPPTQTIMYLSAVGGGTLPTGFTANDFNRQLTSAGASGSISVTVASTTTPEYSYASTPVGFPGTAGYTAGVRSYTVVLNHTTAGTISCGVSLYRMDSSLNIQSGPFDMGGQNLGTVSTHTWTGNFDLGAWNAGDRLLIEYRFATSAAGKGTVITLGAGSYVSVPFGAPAISTATAQKYTVMAGDGGANMTCNVTAIGYQGGNAQMVSTNSIAIATPGAPGASPANTTPPTIAGIVRNGMSVSVMSEGVWTNSPTSFTYKWLADGVVIPNQIQPTINWTTSLSNTYPTLTALTCEIMAGNAVGNTVVTTASVGPLVPDKTFYVSSSKGYDGGNGKSPATAWRTLAQMQANATTGASNTDRNTYYLKTGDSWSESFRPRGNSNYDCYDDAGNLGAAATGDKPKYGMNQTYAVNMDASPSQINNVGFYRQHWDRATTRSIYIIYSNNVTIDNCEVSYNGWSDANQAYLPSGSQSIWMVAGSNFIVSNTYIHHGQGDAIYCDSSPSMWMHHNTILPVFGVEGDCIQIYQGGGTGANYNGTDANILIEDNYLDAWEAYTTNSAKGCFVTQGTGGKIIVRNNICHGSNFGMSINSNNIEVYGNTIDHAVKNSYSFGIGMGEIYDTYNTYIHDNEVFNCNRAIAFTGKNAGANSYCYHYDVICENNYIHNSSRGLRRDKPTTGTFRNNRIENCSVMIENLTTVLPPYPSNNPAGSGAPSNPVPAYNTWTVENNGPA